ncbi:MAG: alanine racemase [Clostridia bacterium]|nr:alanine racemase [Clostridia bacterium]
MQHYTKRTRAEIHLDALTHNMQEIRRIAAPGTEIVAVVKADAYGHGDQQTALHLLKCGADWFAVSNLAEALELRQVGIDLPILILGYTPPECAAQLAYNNITQAVYCSDYAHRLSSFAVQAGVTVHSHIKLDTGMSRIGFFYHDSEKDAATVDEIEQAVRLPGLYCDGIFTHFAQADVERGGEVYTRLQYDLFLHMIALLEQRGITFKHRHCCNSAAIITYPEMHMDMLRAGIILYGLYPSADVPRNCRLKPVMEIKTVVSMVKDIPAGTAFSYGGTFVAKKDMTVATVPIGYADGYPRSLSNKAYMLTEHGEIAPVIGNVCMDQCLLDVTGLQGIEEGTQITVMGSIGGRSVSADFLGEKAGLINYELICGLSRRVPRVYIDGDKVIHTTDYLRDS